MQAGNPHRVRHCCLVQEARNLDNHLSSKIGNSNPKLYSKTSLVCSPTNLEF